MSERVGIAERHESRVVAWYLWDAWSKQRKAKKSRMVSFASNGTRPQRGPARPAPPGGGAGPGASIGPYQYHVPGVPVDERNASLSYYRYV